MKGGKILPTPKNYDVDKCRDIFNREGREIIKALISKYPEKTVESLDIIMNSLIVAMCHFIYNSTGEADYEKIIQIMFNKVLQNLKEVDRK